MPTGGQDLAIAEAEAPARPLQGRVGVAVAAAECAIAVGVLLEARRPLATGVHYYLILFLAGTLPLVFLRHGAGRHRADMLTRRVTPTPLDWALAATALAVCLYPVLPWPGGGYDAFLERAGRLSGTDVLAGGLLLLLILEACRRTTGLVLPIVCVCFLTYAYYGGSLPQSWPIAHAGLDVDQVVDALYNSASGFYGTPLDVAATYIVLFTIYGAVLELSGAGRFFVDLSVAAFRGSRSAAGRTAVAGGFLLGTVSGSGTATTVSIGTVTWPILRRAGYPPENAGGMLAAAGVGAILSPPTLGAAAFIVAEYVEASYLAVLGWALIPTLLYYLGILLAVEMDARRFGVRAVDAGAASAWRLLARFGYHFASLIVIVVLLMVGRTATQAVIAATVVAFALSFLVPVTASFIIGWVVIGPALLTLGVGKPAAAMFVFYYSVLSEVTPPTALAAVGAAAITGARPVPTMWQALKYALPAFLVPLAFVLTGPGEHLLGRGTPAEVASAVAAGALGVAAVAVATGGWVLGVGPVGIPVRVVAGVAVALALASRPEPLEKGAPR